jgi:hypothetical protein
LLNINFIQVPVRNDVFDITGAERSTKTDSMIKILMRVSEFASQEDIAGNAVKTLQVEVPSASATSCWIQMLTRVH